ncbi:MAG: RNA polymerase sigma factor [Clostridia bacterium]|nr:RNA polymerase sigma factor [Clostridia bacterium]
MDRQSEARRVIETYGTMVYRVCYVRLAPVDPTLTDDAYQNVFLTWVEKPPKVTPGSEHEKAWFLRCAVHRCADLIRSRQRHCFEELPESVPCPPEDTTEVMDALLSLPEKYRMPLYLHGVCGYTIEETAAALDLTPAALRMRLTRARRALAAILEQGG